MQKEKWPEEPSSGQKPPEPKLYTIRVKEGKAEAVFGGTQLQLERRIEELSKKGRELKNELMQVESELALLRKSQKKEKESPICKTDSGPYL